MRSIEEIALEEEARLQVERQIRLRGFSLIGGFGLLGWGWWIFHGGAMEKGAAGIILSLFLFFIAFGGFTALKFSVLSCWAGIAAAVPAFFLYHFTKAPFFGWGRDPAFWLSVHTGALGEPFWSPLAYLAGQASCFCFPELRFSLLPELSAMVMAGSIFFIFQEYFEGLKVKNRLTLGFSILVCWLLTVSLPFWNGGTVASGLTGSLGLLLFLIYRRLLSLDEKPWQALCFLWGLLAAIHPLWALLGFLQFFAGRIRGTSFFVILRNNLWTLVMGWTPFLWLFFRAGKFFPDWGGSSPLREAFREWAALWGSHWAEDFDLKNALLAQGWVLAWLGFLTLFLWILNFLNWKHSEKRLMSAKEFWIWAFAGAGGIFFYSGYSRSLGPLSLWFAAGLGGMFLQLLEKMLERRKEGFLAGKNLRVPAGIALVSALGFVFCPSQSFLRSQLYFPQRHALNLLQSLGKKSVLVCEDPFEAAACLETRLMEPLGLNAPIFERRYLGQRWFVAQSILQTPELLFSTAGGSENDFWKSFLINNRENWDIHWAVSVLPEGWSDIPSSPTVLTQEFTGPQGSADPEEFQYRYDLTILPRDSQDSDAERYYFRYVAGFMELGKKLQEENKYSTAIHAYERSAKLDPSFAPPMAALDDMYSKQNILEAARLEFNKMIQVDPGKIAGIMSEIDQARQSKDDNKTVDLLDQVVRLNSELADAQYQLSKIYDKESRPGEAKTLLESSLQLNPRQVEAQLALGKMMAGLGNRIRSEGAFRSVLELDPQNKEAQVELWKLLNQK